MRLGLSDSNPGRGRQLPCTMAGYQPSDAFVGTSKITTDYMAPMMHYGVAATWNGLTSPPLISRGHSSTPAGTYYNGLWYGPSPRLHEAINHRYLKRKKPLSAAAASRYDAMTGPRGQVQGTGSTRSAWEVHSILLLVALKIIIYW